MIARLRQQISLTAIHFHSAVLEDPHLIKSVPWWWIVGRIADIHL